MITIPSPNRSRSVHRRLNPVIQAHFALNVRLYEIDSMNLKFFACRDERTPSVSTTINMWQDNCHGLSLPFKSHVSFAQIGEKSDALTYRIFAKLLEFLTTFVGGDPFARITATRKLATVYRQSTTPVDEGLDSAEGFMT